ncbi:MAG: hypothetical protein K6L75_03165 [Cellvibrionaceae bacterium]|nr:hypothetical protein [Motiliproteus sp.]MCW9052172.1 hypothetical protein [Motiliproteus sp.]
MKRLTIIFALLATLLSWSSLVQAEPAKERLFVHLKTSLKHDDAQICVAYNIIWAALRSGMAVDVMVDADAINTFKTGMLSDKDSIQDYDIPDNLRQAMSEQFSLPLAEVPQTYGDYLIKLNEEGASFYINKGFLIVSKIAPNPDQDLGKIAAYAAKIFQPVSLLEMVEIRKKALFDYSF